ncbi:MAG: T9SS type A sorting domain-containing protein [Bacteroidia bacterium]|nr:T9SS type A sorting domain-containing protein [Bacteroidia bacterium]
MRSFYFLLLFLPFSVSGQLQFQKIIENAATPLWTYSFVNTPHNELVFAGKSIHFPNPLFSDVMMAKTDMSGNLIWMKFFGNTGLELANKIIRTESDEYIMAGYSSDSSTQFVFVTKTDSAGNLLWANQFLIDLRCQGNDIVAAKDSGFWVAGYSVVATSVLNGIVLRLDNSGNLIWAKKIDGNFSQFNKVIPLDNGDVLLSGNSSDFTANSKILLVRMSASGSIIWSKIYGNSTNDIGKEVIELVNGNLMLIADTQGDILFTELDANGSVLWAKTYGGTLAENNPHIKAGANNDYFIAASTLSFIFGTLYPDALLMHVDATGNLLHSFHAGSVDIEFSNDLMPTQDGGCYVAGVTDGFNGDNSIYLLKVDSQFTTGCNQGPTNLSVNSIALFDSSVTIQTTSGALQYPRTGMITASGGQNVILCFTTDISEVSAAQCSVFPNPAQDLINIQSKIQVPSQSYITLTDLKGRVLSIKPFLNSQESISLLGLSPGVYHLKITSGIFAEDFKILKLQE